MRALEQLVREKKIRALGVSNFDVDDLREAGSYLEEHKIVCNQVLYNFEERGVEFELLDYCRENGIAVVAYTPLGGIPPERTKARERLAEVAAKRGLDPFVLALAWVTRDSNCFTIPKAADTAHVAENARAGG
jgi:diketogulonate reductase-like aldo/keto reductase